MKRVFGLVVAGGNGLLADLGVPEDAALTPFAGKYRFIDFALATLVNAGATVVHVAASRPGAVLRAHLRSASRAVRVLGRPFPSGPQTAGRRAERALGDPTVGVLVRKMLMDRRDRWLARVRNQTDHRLGYRDDTNAIVGLLEQPGPIEWDLFTCLNSLRDVEGTVDLVLDQNPTGLKPS